MMFRILLALYGIAFLIAMIFCLILVEIQLGMLACFAVLVDIGFFAVIETIEENAKR